MAALFALGIMSLGWMVFIAALIAAEKLLPWRRLATWSVVLLLALLGIGLMASPSDVPGLTIPGSPAAQHAMQRMGMERHAMPGMHMHPNHTTGDMHMRSRPAQQRMNSMPMH